MDILTWIYGQAEPGSGQAFTCSNPRSGEIYIRGCYSDPHQVDRAVNGARLALDEWWNIGLQGRLNILEHWKFLLEQQSQKMVDLLVLETGRPRWECENELRAVLEKWPLTISAVNERAHNYNAVNGESVEYRSVGVFGILGPFNFPLHLPHGQILPALLSGGCAVFKPSEFTPLSAQFYVELGHKAGLRPGVLNLVYGSAEVGMVLVKHSLVNAILFTGSRNTGKAIHLALSDQPQKILALEMGGSNPLIVMESGSRQAVAANIVVSAFISSGQRCSCARRLIIVRHEGDRLLLDLVVKMARSLRIGMSYGEEIFSGPLIHENARKQALDFQEKLLKRGARSLLKAQALSPGAWITPSIMELEAHAFISDVECFAPILQVCFVDSLEKALATSNATPYGLSAGLLGGVEEDFHFFRRRIQAASISWNVATTGASSRLPFGGMCESGNHRPAGYFMIDSCVQPIACRQSPEVSMPKATLYGCEGIE